MCSGEEGAQNSHGTRGYGSDISGDYNTIKGGNGKRSLCSASLSGPYGIRRFTSSRKFCSMVTCTGPRPAAGLLRRVQHREALAVRGQVQILQPRIEKLSLAPYPGLTYFFPRLRYAFLIIPIFCP